MTDQDRGAYTPPTDEAIAFDARRQTERRPVPMTLVGSAVVLVVLIVGVAVVYRGGVRGADEAPRPIGQPVVSVKTAPSMTDATANTVATLDEAEGKSADAAPASVGTPAPVAPATPPKTAVAAAPGPASPTFAPAPEQPAPRPEPAAKTMALLDQPGQAQTPARAESPARVKVVPPAGKPIRTAGGLDASEVAAAGMTGAASAPAHAASTAPSGSQTFKVATATPKPAFAQAARTKSAAATANAPTIDSVLDQSRESAGGPVVQIGAFSSAALSDQGYADVSRIMVGHMTGKAKHVMTVDHAGATLFRTWVSGFASRAQAQAFCDALKARNKPCFVKG